jgi:hypothetical protein
MDYNGTYIRSSFPSVFIRLPKMPENRWVTDDIIDVLCKYGEVKEVRIKKDNSGGQFAIVHFNKCYHEGIKIANEIHKGNAVKVPALYRRQFNLIPFNMPKPVNRPMHTLPIAPGLSFGNPGQLSVAEFVAQKKRNELAASNFNQMFSGNNDDLTEFLYSRRPRANSEVSDITMEDDLMKMPVHYYQDYQLEEGEII